MCDFNKCRDVCGSNKSTKRYTLRQYIIYLKLVIRVNLIIITKDLKKSKIQGSFNLIITIKYLHISIFT